MEISQVSVKNSQTSVGIRIEAVLQKLGYKSALDFSKQNRIKASTLYAIINGAIKKPSSNLLGIFQKAGVNVSWILTGEGEMFIVKSQEIAPETVLPQLVEAEKLGVQQVTVRAPKPIGWREFNQALEGFLLGADENSVDLILRRLHIWQEAHRKD